MKNYNIVCEIMRNIELNIIVENMVNELDKSVVLKKSSKKIWKNILRDPISLSLLAIPVPTGGALTVANVSQHLYRNKSSRRHAALIAKKYGVSPKAVMTNVSKLKVKSGNNLKYYSYPRLAA